MRNRTVSVFILAAIAVTVGLIVWGYMKGAGETSGAPSASLLTPRTARPPEASAGPAGSVDPLVVATRQAFDSVISTGADAAKLELELAAPIKNELPSVAGLETAFEAQVSLRPLLQQKLARLEYDTDVTSFTKYLIDGEVVMPDSSTHTTKGFNTLDFKDAPDKPDEVVYTETFGLRDETGKTIKSQSLERMQNVDGRHTEPPNSAFKQHYSEKDPKFPAKNIKKGDVWTQRIAVDPALNPGGETSASFRVESTYEKDGQRYVRLSRDYMFATYLPQNGPDGKPLPQVGKQKQVVRYHVNEAFDLAVDTGIVAARSTVQRQYFPCQTSAGNGKTLEGMLVESRSLETLKETRPKG